MSVVISTTGAHTSQDDCEKTLGSPGLTPCTIDKAKKVCFFREKTELHAKFQPILRQTPIDLTVNHDH